MVIVANARVDGVAEHLPDVGSGGERRSAIGGDGIPVDVVGVREVSIGRQAARIGRGAALSVVTISPDSVSQTRSQNSWLHRNSTTS